MHAANASPLRGIRLPSVTLASHFLLALIGNTGPYLPFASRPSAAVYVNGGVKFGHCGGAKVGQFGASALERAALI